MGIALWGYIREQEPEPETRPHSETKGWATAYAPRQPANQMDRVAAMLRQYGEGNFGGAAPGRTPGLSWIRKKGLAVTLAASGHARGGVQPGPRDAATAPAGNSQRHLVHGKKDGMLTQDVVGHHESR